MIGFNTDLRHQTDILTDILKQNHILFDVISNAEKIGLPDYFIGAGCIVQTVWNYQIGNDLMYGISDIDFVYFDNTDLSFEAENNCIARVSQFVNTDVKLDIKNEARVHLWYKEKFGYDIKPYLSVEDAINTWPTTATSIGVRLQNGVLKVYAPFGLNDLFGMIVRANKAQITKEIYMQKVNKWISKWPSLTVIDW